MPFLHSVTLSANRQASLGAAAVKNHDLEEVMVYYGPNPHEKRNRDMDKWKKCSIDDRYRITVPEEWCERIEAEKGDEIDLIIHTVEDWKEKKRKVEFDEQMQNNLVNHEPGEPSGYKERWE